MEDSTPLMPAIIKRSRAARDRPNGQPMVFSRPIALLGDREIATMPAEATRTRLTTSSDHWFCGDAAQLGFGSAKKLGTHTRRPNKLIIAVSRRDARRAKTPVTMARPAAICAAPVR